MSTRPPLVSAIVPTYNCAGILPGCLDSLLAQDYPALEVLVVDGGSRDGTAEIARGYGAPVRVRSEPDRGIYDAMNKGIADAGGEWLYFIGADDALADPRVVADVMDSEAARDEGTLMVYGDVIPLSLGTRYRGRTEAPEIVGDNNICHQAAFYRRRLFDLEGTYELRYRLFADWDLNMRIYLRHPGTHRYIDRVIANYAGGASAFTLDETFLAERCDNAWRYAREGGCEGTLRGVFAALYYEEIMAAVKQRKLGAALRLLAVAQRRGSILPYSAGRMIRKLRRGSPAG